MKNRSASVIALMAIAFGLWACGNEVIGDALVDAGRVLRDSGMAVRDSSTASAQVIEAECDIQEGSAWYAEASVDIDISTVQVVSAIKCGLEGTIPQRGNLPCASDTEVSFSESRIRVYCGAGNPEMDGHRYTDIRFVVE